MINLVVALREPEHTKILHNELLTEAGEHICIAAAETANLIALVARLQPHVLLLDHERGASNATSGLLTAALACSSGLRVLLRCANDGGMLEAVRLGAHGCVSHGLRSAEVAKAVQSVAVGQVWFPREWMLRQMTEQAGEPARREPPSANDEGQKLTAREREIVALIGCGMTNKQIARKLKISDKTVQTQLHRVYVKLNVSGRCKAFAMVHGLESAASLFEK